MTLSLSRTVNNSVNSSTVRLNCAEPPFNVPRRFYIERFGLVGDPPDLTLDAYRARHRSILAFFHDAGLAGKVRFIWPAAALCGKRNCPMVENGNPVYFDHNHLSIYGAGKTSPLYDGIFIAPDGQRR